MSGYPLKYLFPLCFSACLAHAAHYHAAPEGNAANSGLIPEAPWDGVTALLRLRAGDTLSLASGLYTIPRNDAAANTLELKEKGTAAHPITVLAKGPGRAVFDFSYPALEWTQDGYGIHLTGDYWYFRGLDVTRAGYQGVYVTGSHNTFVNCSFYENRNTGFEINEGGAYTVVVGCDAYRNYDPKKSGSMADGFAPKQTQGPGNSFYDCRAWENSDDGYDTYDSPEKVVFEDCWAFRNGVDVWNQGGFSGNGNGFKLGGNHKQANHRAVRCVAFGNPGKGFDQNNNTGGLSIFNGIGYRNGRNFGLGNPLNPGQEHMLANNVSLDGPVEAGGASGSHNSWNAGFAPAASDFASLDTALARIPRDEYGAVPATSLFRLRDGSPLIDAGVEVGLGYRGDAPDLGAFEYGSGAVGLSDARIRSDRAYGKNRGGSGSRKRSGIPDCAYSALGESTCGSVGQGFGLRKPLLIPRASENPD